MKVSVCIATHNGEKYFKKQLQSIIYQLRIQDEVIISDDCSSDKTVDTIRSFNDSRIKYIGSFNFKSPIYNFENAIKNTKGDILILADQDDIWLPGRLESAVSVLSSNENIDLVVCKCEIIDSNGKIIKNSYFKDHNPVNHSFFWNLYHNPYLGCCMAFKRRVLEFALPFPKKLAMHDIWIGLVTQLNGNCVYYEKPLIQYRIHNNNYTKESPYRFFGKIHYRMQLLLRIYFRILKYRVGKMNK